MIVCEGNYNRGSGDIWFYDTASHKVYPSIFKSRNGFDLGNVVQSYYRSGDRGFIVVNNSGKVAVVEANTFKQVGALTNLQSPRYLIPSSQPDQAYATDLYSGQIAIVQTQTLSKLGSIQAGSWTEQGVLIGDTAYIISRRAQFDTRPGGENLLLIDTRTNRIVDSLKLGTGGEEILYDMRRKSLWLSFEHDAGGAGKARLVRYDLACRCIADEVEFDGLKPTRLSLSPDGQYLFFVQEGITYIRTDVPTLLRKAIPKPLNWTSLKVIAGQDGRYRLLACDARDYISPGLGYDLDFHNGAVTVRDSFEVGIIPGNVY